MWLANKFAFLVLAVAVLSQIASESPGFAQEGRYAVRNTRHTSWTSEKGVSAVFEIQQDSNGYLWLNTANGVVRFDGVRFQSLEDATNNALRSSDIRAAYIAPSGRIWFTTRTAGLILLESGHTGVYSSDRRCISVAANGGMVEDPDGSLWIKALSGLYHLRGFSCEQVTEAGGYPGGFPAAILVDRQGTVWVKAPSGALLFRRKNDSKFELSQYVSSPTSQPAFLHEGPDGSIWLSDEDGLRRLNQTGRQTPVTGRVRGPHFGDFAFGRDGSLWSVVDKGISRFDKTTWGPKGTVSAGDADSASRFEELSSNAIWNLSVDREDTVWIGTNSGLDSVRATAFKTILLPAEEHEFSLAAGDNGSVWTGNATLPLTRLYPDGRFIRSDKSHNVVCVRRDHKGTIWSADEGPNQLWRSSLGDISQVHYPEEKMARIVSLAVDGNNEPWINIRPGTTFHLSHGTWKNENEAIGKDIGILGAMVNDTDGIVWIAFTNLGGQSRTRGYLVRWDGASYQKYSFTDSRFDVSVGTMAARGDHVWLAGTGGIVLFTRGNFYRMDFIDPKLPGRVSGIVETEKGDLWANGFTGITHISGDELARWIKDPTSKVAGDHLDAFDGLPGLSAERFPEPSVVEASNGRIWFATMRGIAWLDENALVRIHNSIPPPVFVTTIIVNGKAYSGISNLTLPKHTQNLEIDYTALSLAVPERVCFRYRLEGVDKDWQEPGSRRQAFYTNLSPGRYTFHVTASNNDGVWNGEGASFQFGVAPAFYQTTWFILLCGIVLLALAWAAFQWRLRQVEVRARLQMEERLSERARIARELHDTLLQSFQGLILKFQRARNLLPARPDQAMESLDTALDRAERAIMEGRDAIHDIRVSVPADRDVAAELSALGAELASANGPSDSPVCHVVVEGNPKAIRPSVRDEIVRVASEALRNAYAHAHARHIEAEIRYEERMLRVRIRDDGIGINQEHLGEAGRAGHYGLRGMRERAAQMEAQLDVWSEQGAGTEIDLSIPDRVAYKADKQLQGDASDK
jgi:signal transduction histidine kinase/ligand-binding sensor domain-containing protein